MKRSIAIVHAVQSRGYVPERQHFPVCEPPPKFGYLSRLYAADGLVVRTTRRAEYVEARA